MAVGFAHQRHQNVQRLDQAFACRLGMHHRPLDDALEAERGLGFDRVQKVVGNLRGIFGNAGGELFG